MIITDPYILTLDLSGYHVLSLIGGKAAALGELNKRVKEHGLAIPQGFTITTRAYKEHVTRAGLITRIRALENRVLANLDEEAWFEEAALVRAALIACPLDDFLLEQILKAYRQLCDEGVDVLPTVAVRSSAITEDQANASAAGQHDSFLHVDQAGIAQAVLQCMASYMSNRALSYRAHNGQDSDAGIAILMQRMVDASQAASGVAFTLDTETGDDRVVLITANYGLGQALVQGSVTPDEFLVHKERLRAGYAPIIRAWCGSKQEKACFIDGVVALQPVSVSDQVCFSLTQKQVLEVAHAACRLEEIERVRTGKSSQTYDIEWAYDAHDGKLYIVQIRPETVHAVKSKLASVLTYRLKKEEQVPLVRGIRVGSAIVHGRAVIAHTREDAVSCGADTIVVTRMTDPDWMPILKKVRGIVTDQGGRTCHAAIVSRELGLAAVVGAGNAMQILAQYDAITLDTATAVDEGRVYAGYQPYTSEEKQDFNFSAIPTSAEHDKNFYVYVTLADPTQAADLSQLPLDGVGLVRLELVIAHEIGVHPRACFEEEKLSKEERALLREKSAGYGSSQLWYQALLRQAVGRIATAFYPRQVTVRLTDLKSNEYRGLLAGEHFEVEEENPMLGLRGAARYLDPAYQQAFDLECQAMMQVWHEMGCFNMQIMVPFVRTVAEARAVVERLWQYGMGKINNGPALIMMVELPSNVLLLEEFGHYFDGFSIGSNDLTQLTLGIDRDAGMRIADGDERNQAVVKLMLQAISSARKIGKPISICGQAPSDFPELAQQLIEAGITGISLNRDVVITFLENTNHRHTRINNRSGREIITHGS